MLEYRRSPSAIIFSLSCALLAFRAGLLPDLRAPPELLAQVPARFPAPHQTHAARPAHPHVLGQRPSLARASLCGRGSKTIEGPYAGLDLTER